MRYHWLFPALAAFAACDAARDRPAGPFAPQLAGAEVAILRPGHDDTVLASDLFGPGVNTLIEARRVTGPGFFRVTAWAEQGASFYDAHVAVHAPDPYVALLIRPRESGRHIARAWISAELLDDSARVLAGDTVVIWVHY
jgi:hypothetical protein